MQNHRGSQQRRQERRENKRVARALLTDSGALRAARERAPWSRHRPWRTCPAPPGSATCGGWAMGSADLQVAITDLRNALGDELGGNDQVRDCAFEVVAAYDREIAARATHCARCNTTAPGLVNGWLYGPMCLICAEVALSDIASALTCSPSRRNRAEPRRRPAGTYNTARHTPSRAPSPPGAPCRYPDAGLVAGGSIPPAVRRRYCGSKELHMHVGVPSIIALVWVILVSGCAGNEIAPAEQSAAPAPGDGDPITALYAAPADVAFITVSDLTADIVGPDDVSFDATFFGYRYAAELVTPFVDRLDDDNTLAPPVLAGPETVAPPVSNNIGWDILSAPPDAK